MAPRNRSGRAAAEVAYANLLKESTTLVGDVGETWEAFKSNLAATAAALTAYQQARATAIKAGAITNEQLDQLGYKRGPRLPALSDDASEPTAKRTPTGNRAASPSAGEPSPPAAIETQELT